MKTNNERYIIRCDKELSADDYEKLKEHIADELNGDCPVVILPGYCELVHVISYSPEYPADSAEELTRLFNGAVTRTL